MPVVTRYALRSKTSSAGNNSNPTTNAAPVISETTTNARPVLGEVAGNSEASTAPDDQTTQEEPAKKSTAKGNSAAINANSKIETTQQGIGNTSVVLPEEENDGPLPVEEAVGDSEAVDGIPEAMLGEGHQKGAVSLDDVCLAPKLRVLKTNGASTKVQECRPNQKTEEPSTSNRRRES